MYKNTHNTYKKTKHIFKKRRLNLNKAMNGRLADTAFVFLSKDRQPKCKMLQITVLILTTVVHINVTATNIFIFRAWTKSFVLCSGMHQETAKMSNYQSTFWQSKCHSVPELLPDQKDLYHQLLLPSLVHLHHQGDTPYTEWHYRQALHQRMEISKNAQIKMCALIDKENTILILKYFNIL